MPSQHGYLAKLPGFNLVSHVHMSRQKACKCMQLHTIIMYAHAYQSRHHMKLNAKLKLQLQMYAAAYHKSHRVYCNRQLQSEHDQDELCMICICTHANIL